MEERIERLKQTQAIDPCRQVPDKLVLKSGMRTMQIMKWTFCKIYTQEKEQRNIEQI